LLKKFPVNGSSIKQIEENIEKKSQNNEKISIKNVISAEIDSIKQEIEQVKPVVINDEIKLLGELLGYLRQNKEMSLLMLCRQIDKIELEGNTVVIFSQDDEVQSLVSNERYSQELNSFFKQKGLGFRVHENKHEISPVDALNRILGGKLIVKN
jgi:hypothetical protein